MTVLATANGLDYFEETLGWEASIDAIGISYFPIFYVWRIKKLLDYRTIYDEANCTKEFWLSEIGTNSFNHGEDGQARFLTKILSMASNEEELNVDGVSIFSLRDNTGYAISRGLTSHLGLVYFTGKKKKAFHAVQFAVEAILGIS